MAVIDPVTGAPNPAKGISGRITSRPPNAIAITPDPVKVYDPPIELYVGGAGNVLVVPYGRNSDATVLFTAAPAGSMLPVLCKQVLAAATTATQLVGIF
jgi:hypothetical protein